MNDPLAERLTPPKLAKIWGVKPEKVIAFIKSGELDAIDISKHPGIGRPRYRISVKAVMEFENRRSVKPPPKRMKKPIQSAEVEKFF